MSISEQISKIKSKRSGVSTYLNERNLGGLRKQEPEEKSERNAVSSWVRYSRNLEKLQKMAKLENSELEDKILKLEKESSDLRWALRELEQLTLQNQHFSRNPLVKLLNSQKIKNWQIKSQEIIFKKGTVDQITTKINQNKIQLELLKKKYYENENILRQEKPKPAKEVLEGYYKIIVIIIFNQTNLNPNMSKKYKM